MGDSTHISMPCLWKNLGAPEAKVRRLIVLGKGSEVCPKK